MTRPARALLDARALQHNLGRVRAYAPRSKIMAIVKANGYGHGLTWVAQALPAVDAFGVASAEEGMELRAAGIKQHICLLQGFFDAQELPLLAEHRLSPVIHQESQLRELERAALKEPIEVWLKIDTGMHRIGFPPPEAPPALARLKACAGVKHVRVLSHFANADNRSDPMTSTQTERFLAIAGNGAWERSLANSAGIVSWPASHLEWVRPGIMLYGAAPLTGAGAAELELRPVMSLQSALIAVQRLRKGETVGYGGDWTCPQDMPVGVVAIGYGDGYPRQTRAGAPVLINGRRTPLIGRVSMDMITVDLRGQPEARVGDPAILWGEGLPVDEVASHAGTIGYSLLCGVTPRIPRIKI